LPFSSDSSPQPISGEVSMQMCGSVLPAGAKPKQLPTYTANIAGHSWRRLGEEQLEDERSNTAL